MPTNTNSPTSNYTPPSYQSILNSAIQNYTQMANYFGYNLQITPSDEIYIRLSTYASLMTVMYQYLFQLTNGNIVDTATGLNLDRIANFLGLQRRAANSSQGAVGLVATATQTIVAGTLLTGPNSLIFQVQYTGTYSNGQNVGVVSVSQGAATNVSTNSIMTWQSPTGTMQSTALVTVACTGGTDAEDDETLRNRIYAVLQSPPQMGNASQVVTTAGSVDNLIQQAFTYANFNGAGTQLIVLTGYQTSSYIGRDLPHLQYDNYIQVYPSSQAVLNPSLTLQSSPGFGAYNQWTASTPNPPTGAGGNPFGAPGTYVVGTPQNDGPNLAGDSSIIYGQMPVTVANQFATVITTVNNYPSDVAVNLTLPYPQGASPNGFGNGWLQATPWPVPDGYYVQNYCKVTSVVSSTTITISAPSSGTYNTGNPNASFVVYNNHVPVQGQTQIQWVNRSDANQQGWSVITATVLTAVDNGNQTWTVTLDTPLIFAAGSNDFYGNTGVAIGDFIFPAATNTQTYINNILSSYALLGPGEVTNNVDLQNLGALRYPNSSSQFSNVLAGPAEKLLESNSEVYSAELDPGNGQTANGGTYYLCWNTAYLPPSSTGSPPLIYIPRQLAFYPNETYNNFGV